MTTLMTTLMTAAACTAEGCLKVTDLLTCPKAKCAAWTLAAISFVLGMIVMCLACKLFRPCGKKACAKQAQQPARSDRGEQRFERRHPAPADGSIEIYVGNLSYDLTEEQLNAAFAAYGKVNSARIITNRFNGKSKGFGFVHMPNVAEADAAVAALNDTDLCGRKLRCNKAKNVG